MKYVRAAAAACLFLASTASALAADWKPEPLKAAVKSSVSACSAASGNRMPVIEWGADMATSLANGNAARTASGSLFNLAKLDVTLYKQNNFKTQVEDYLACRTPFLRGTLGMLSHAAELLNEDPRTAPVVIIKLSDSVGGDALVVRDHIKSPKDLKGKTIAVQAYGPHVDYLLKVLADAGVSSSDVKIRWTRDLTDDTAQADWPGKAMLNDKTLDAAFVIIPNALNMTSGGTIGARDSEETCKGCRILLSTKTASRVITDVIAVRKDFYDANRAKIAALVSGLFQAQEKAATLMRKPKNDTDRQSMIKAAATLILGSAAGPSLENMTGMWSDQEIAGYPGNVKFFQEAGNPRSFSRMSQEIQTALVGISLLSKASELADAGWDYKALAQGLVQTTVAETPRFNEQAVQQIAEKRMQQGAKQEGVLFEFEVRFGPNQNEFPADQYRTAFEKVISLTSTYGGAIMTIEGHSDPLAYLKLKKSGTNEMVLDQQRQAAKNLSYTRANALRDSLVKYALTKGITLDPSQFGVVGYGVSQPNTPNCRRSGGDIDFSCAPANQQQWDATRRVSFKLVQIEAESDAFVPLN